MDYPKQFSAQAIARVEAAQLRAAAELRKADLPDPIPAWQRLGVFQGESAFYVYVLSVFTAFTIEIIELCRQGVLSIPPARGVAEEFLRRFVIKAYSDKDSYRHGLRVSDPISNWSGHLLDRPWKIIRQSPQWEKYESKLLEVIERQASASEKPERSTPSSPADRLNTHPPGLANGIHTTPKGRQSEDSEGSAKDPCDVNPFPATDPHHKIWADATSVIKAKGDAITASTTLGHPAGNGGVSTSELKSSDPIKYSLPTPDGPPAAQGNQPEQNDTEYGPNSAIAIERMTAKQAYKDECLRKDIKVSDPDIGFAAAKHRTPTELKKWQSNSPQQNPGMDALVRKVFREKPHLQGRGFHPDHHLDSEESAPI